jgi:hypothetical protein
MDLTIKCLICKPMSQAMVFILYGERKDYCLLSHSQAVDNPGVRLIIIYNFFGKLKLKNTV